MESNVISPIGGEVRRQLFTEPQTPMAKSDVSSAPVAPTTPAVKATAKTPGVALKTAAPKTVSRGNVQPQTNKTNLMATNLGLDRTSLQTTTASKTSTKQPTKPTMVTEKRMASSIIQPQTTEPKPHQPTQEPLKMTMKAPTRTITTDLTSQSLADINRHMDRAQMGVLRWRLANARLQASFYQIEDEFKRVLNQKATELMNLRREMAQLQAQHDLADIYRDIEISVEAQRGMALDMVKHYIEEFEQMGRALMSAEHFLPVTDVRLDMDKFGEFLREVGPQLDHMLSFFQGETKLLSLSETMKELATATAEECTHLQKTREYLLRLKEHEDMLTSLSIDASM